MKQAFFAILVIFAVWVGYNLMAASFEPLFQIVSFEGECHVQPPDAKSFQPAEVGKTYAYGTAIKTGRKSTALIRFSEGNECRVMANANIVITEDVRDPKLKIIKLREGEVDVSLDEKFGESNGLNVETATAICGAIGCKFTVRSSTDNDLTAVVIMCKEGKIRAWGKDFNIPLLEAEDGVSIVGNGDLSFIKIRNVLGNFNIHVRDASGNEKIFEFKKDWEIKIWRKVSADNKTIIITILISGPDGALVEAITRTAPVGGEETAGGEQGQEGQETLTQEGKTTSTTQSSGEGEELITETPTTTIPATATTMSPAELERTDQLLYELGGNPPPPPPPPPSHGGGDTEEEGGDHHNPTPSGHP